MKKTKVIAIKCVVGSKITPEGTVKLWQGEVPLGWEECKNIKITDDMFKDMKSPHESQF